MRECVSDSKGGTERAWMVCVPRAFLVDNTFLHEVGGVRSEQCVGQGCGEGGLSCTAAHARESAVVQEVGARRARGKRRRGAHEYPVGEPHSTTSDIITDFLPR